MRTEVQTKDRDPRGSGMCRSPVGFGGASWGLEAPSVRSVPNLRRKLISSHQRWLPCMTCCGVPAGTSTGDLTRLHSSFAIIMDARYGSTVRNEELGRSADVTRTERQEHSPYHTLPPNWRRRQASRDELATLSRVLDCPPAQR